MRSASTKILFILLPVMLVVAILLSVGMGAVSISPMQTLSIFAHKAGIATHTPFTSLQERVLTGIRMPRVLLAVLIGASLAVTGAAMQGLFRNALADPALIGISAGATVTAVGTIVLSKTLLSGIPWISGMYGLSVVTFIGAVAATSIIYTIAHVNGRIVITTMLLTGIAINAFANGIVGLFTYNANDAQLRSITFWTLGSLGGATWANVTTIVPFTLLPVLLLPFFAKLLNAFSMGEATAIHLGANAETAKRIILVLAALCVGASVSVAGVIGFVGLVTPHIIRTVCGPDHRHLLPLSAIAGALLLSLADLICRTAFAPAEMPVGIVTAIMGAPFFMWILIKDRKNLNLA